MKFYVILAIPYKIHGRKISASTKEERKIRAVEMRVLTGATEYTRMDRRRNADIMITRKERVNRDKTKIYK